jgi:twitching motility two-component system response regulator PilH
VGIFDHLRSIFDKTAPEQPSAAEPKLLPVDRRGFEWLNAREGTRVLIIDDSPTIIAVLRKILGSARLVTSEAVDAETGIELMRSDQPNLVFLDVVLPGIDGFAALRAMRRDPLIRHIPVILMSGNEQAADQFYANRIGADDFMKKPFSRLDVFTRIERLLDGDMIPRRITPASDETGSSHGASASVRRIQQEQN